MDFSRSRGALKDWSLRSALIQPRTDRQSPCEIRIQNSSTFPPPHKTARVTVLACDVRRCPPVDVRDKGQVRVKLGQQAQPGLLISSIYDSRRRGGYYSGNQPPSSFYHPLSAESVNISWNFMNFSCKYIDFRELSRSFRNSGKLL